ncbi:hypothetical protein, partial [Teichococcus cervicalis]|uniref:hypothetical protein n=1 Tax=Teichococcus cervicalis TaxID=204525 RepID=UPI00058F3449
MSGTAWNGPAHWEGDARPAGNIATDLDGAASVLDSALHGTPVAQGLGNLALGAKLADMIDHAWNGELGALTVDGFSLAGGAAGAAVGGAAGGALG